MGLFDSILSKLGLGSAQAATPAAPADAPSAPAAPQAISQVDVVAKLEAMAAAKKRLVGPLVALTLVYFLSLP